MDRGQSFKSLPSPFDGHFEIQQSDIDVPFMEVLDCFAAVPCHGNFISFRSEGIAQSCENLFIVVGEQ